MMEPRAIAWKINDLASLARAWFVRRLATAATTRFSTALLLLFFSATSALSFDDYRVSDDEWEAVRKHYQSEGLTLEQIDLWRDYCVAEDPGPRPPIGNEAFAELGYCDVTSAPFNADRTGSEDSTESIRRAMHYARAFRLALFFPPGDYLISDMLHAHQCRVIRSGTFQPGTLEPVGAPMVMVGSTGQPDKRARLVLRKNSPGYNDPTDPKYVVLINQPIGPNKQGETPLTYDSSTVNYDNYFGSIDIVVQEGNPGAIGLRMRGAEGTGIMDVTIDMRQSGLTGMQCTPGSGGSSHGVTVLGGRIGISTADWLPGMPYDNKQSGTQPGPTLSSIRLYNQSEWALLSNSRGALVVVGADIRTEKQGPVIDLTGKTDTFANCLALIDSRIAYSGHHPNNSVIEAERSFYFRNVFVENGASIAPGVEGGKDWTHVAELAVSKTPKRYGKAMQAEERIWIDGKRIEKDIYFVQGDEPTPAADLIDRHHWGTSPTFESPDAAHVKSYGARGDGETDDTAAIQKAIDTHALVFLPKGDYKIKNTLQLRPNTKLFGVHPVYSVINAVSNHREGRFGGDNPDPVRNGRPAVETVNEAAAETYLGFVGIHTDAIWGNHDPTPMGLYSLKWQCGRKSVVRQIAIGPKKHFSWNIHTVWKGLGHDTSSLRQTDPNRLLNIYDAFEEDAAPIKHHPVLVTGNGGGKWFNFWFHGYYPFDNHTRLMKIDGTTEPFQVYHLHGQHTHAAAVFEINHARNVDIYGTKSEFHTRFMDIIDSKNIRVYGMGGAFGPGIDVKGERQPFYLVKNCDDFLIAACGQQVSTWGNDHIVVGGGRFPLVTLPVDSYEAIRIETVDGGRVKIPRQDRPILFKLGNPLHSGSL